MTAADVRDDRLAREARAADRARQLGPGTYHADGNDVVRQGSAALGTSNAIAARCESHWDACLVLLALPEGDQ